jgi:peroxiredoxin
MKLYQRGIDKIYFVSVNDPFVMQEWAKSFNENDIGFIADSYGDFLNDIDAMIDLTP